MFFETSFPSYQPSAPHLSCSSSTLSIFNFHCHFNIHRLCCSIPPSLRSSSFLPSLPTLPHYPPTSAQGCQSFRDPVSCEIAQIAVALRLAQQQRGEIDREEERKRERERFYASTLLNLNHPPHLPCPPHSLCPFLPLFTQTWTSTRTAARLHIYPLQPKYLPPTHTHTHSQLLHPHHHHHL